ncbi:MAG: hypothetical protein WC860_00835 [Candidatus Margulisiibacteriota bacterium]|jgi:hypothetical protein
MQAESLSLAPTSPRSTPTPPLEKSPAATPMYPRRPSTPDITSPTLMPINPPRVAPRHLPIEESEPSEETTELTKEIAKIETQKNKELEELNTQFETMKKALDTCLKNVTLLVEVFIAKRTLQPEPTTTKDPDKIVKPSTTDPKERNYLEARTLVSSITSAATVPSTTSRALTPEESDKIYKAHCFEESKIIDTSLAQIIEIKGVIDTAERKFQSLSYQPNPAVINKELKIKSIETQLKKLKERKTYFKDVKPLFENIKKDVLAILNNVKKSDTEEFLKQQKSLNQLLHDYAEQLTNLRQEFDA